MAIAHDAATVIGTGTGTIEGTHTPTGTPKGVVVAIVQDGSAEEVTAVTYGGVSLKKEVFKGQATAEAGSSQFWFLGSEIPTGAQTVKVTVSGSNTRAVTCMTVTAGEDTKVAATGSTAEESATNPSVTLKTGAIETVTYGATFSGEQASGVGVGGGLTQLAENQLTSISTSYNVLRRTENPSADTTVSWTWSNDECAAVGIAVKEASKEAPKFPEVITTAETAVTTAGTSHAINLPSGIESGDLILILTDKGSTAATFNEKAGYTELVDENAGNGITMWVRDADGTEGATVTFTSSASTRSASIAFRITGAMKASEQKPELSTVATGTSVEADPGKVEPTGGSKNYLWIAMCGYAGEEADDDTWANTPPTNFEPSPPLQKACGTVGTNLGGKIAAAYRGNTAASEDPGAFNVDVSAAWRAFTIAVHPKSTGGELKTIEKGDTLSLSESLVRLPSLLKADTTTLSEKLVKGPNLPKADSLTLSEALTKRPGDRKSVV